METGADTGTMGVLTRGLLITIASRGWKLLKILRWYHVFLSLLITIPSRGWKLFAGDSSNVLVPVVINHNPLTGMETLHAYIWVHRQSVINHNPLTGMETSQTRTSSNY